MTHNLKGATSKTGSIRSPLWN